MWFQDMPFRPSHHFDQETAGSLLWVGKFWSHTNPHPYRNAMSEVPCVWIHSAEWTSLLVGFAAENGFRIGEVWRYLHATHVIFLNTAIYCHEPRCESSIKNRFASKMHFLRHHDTAMRSTQTSIWEAGHTWIARIIYNTFFISALDLLSLANVTCSCAVWLFWGGFTNHYEE